jgi:hypothetical protein
MRLPERLDYLLIALPRYDIIVTDISRFVVLYAIMYLAFYSAVQTISKSYLPFFAEFRDLSSEENCDYIVESLGQTEYWLFTLTFGDSMLDALRVGISGPDNSCGGLQVLICRC